ncbi:hypothetical protein H6F75_00460 [Nodosilinea sp. FACHB-131]|uniref:hypothetical protein n=1 Tax=Cyanophyceae TaxID=3028117 RepID=UPI0016886D50|nr:hypothetical protein [Nodosilinea sp. FACHB-131]MBD1871942.1 hypothetical protein [Nodosilinea sp. FACHB-131]
MPPCDISRRTRKRILIAAPQTLKTTYDAPADAFDGTVTIGGVVYDLLRVFPTPDGYKRRERNRENKGLRFNYDRATFTPYTPGKDVDIEITAIVNAATVRVLQAVYELHATSGMSGGAASLVTLYDYCRPDLADWATAIAGNTEPVTVRHGAIELGEMGAVVGRAIGPWSEQGPVTITFRQVS